MLVKVRCYELPGGPSWLCSLPLSPMQHRAAVFQPRAWQIVHYSICSWDHPTAQLAVVLFILKISNSHISSLISRGRPKDSHQKLWTAEHLTQGFRGSAERKWTTASPAPSHVRKTQSFSVLPEAFLLLPSSPHLADEVASELHFAPPKVDAHGPHILLSELFPGQRFFLQKQSPTCNTIKASIAYITWYYVSKTQNTP